MELLHGAPSCLLVETALGRLLNPLLSHVLGQRLVTPGSANETSSILVESVTRSSTETCYSAIPKSSSDASKVTSKGAGLSKAFVGQKSSFLVDCSKAGRQHGPEGTGRGQAKCCHTLWSSVLRLAVVCPCPDPLVTHASSCISCPVLLYLVLLFVFCFLTLSYDLKVGQKGDGVPISDGQTGSVSWPLFCLKSLSLGFERGYSFGCQ